MEQALDRRVGKFPRAFESPVGQQRVGADFRRLFRTLVSGVHDEWPAMGGKFVRPGLNSLLARFKDKNSEPTYEVKEFKQAVKVVARGVNQECLELYFGQRWGNLQPVLGEISGYARFLVVPDSLSVEDFQRWVLVANQVRGSFIEAPVGYISSLARVNGKIFLRETSYFGRSEYISTSECRRLVTEPINMAGGEQSVLLLGKQKMNVQNYGSAHI